MKFQACFPISVLSLADYSNDFNLLFYKSFSGEKNYNKLHWPHETKINAEIACNFSSMHNS